MNKPFKGTSQYLLHYHIHGLFSCIAKISVIWWRVNTRTQINKPWNWSTCAESLFSKTLQGHQLKPREQHWFQSDKTPMCCPVPHWAGPCLRGFHWQHNRLAQLEAQGEVSGTLLREYTDCYWRWAMAGCPLPVTAWQTMEPPFLHTPTQELWTLFGISCLIGTAPVCVPDISFS